jgi:oligosaccharide repeat unit polymerase
MTNKSEMKARAGVKRREGEFGEQNFAYTGSELRSSVYLAICIAGAAFGVVWGGTETSLAVGVACSVTSLLIVWHERVNFAGSRLVRWYFLFCAVHALAGYLGAAPVIYQINAGSGIQRSLRESFLVVSYGSLCAAVGYSLSSRRAGSPALSRQSSRESPFHRFLIWVRLLAIAGILVMIYLVHRLGYFPILASSPGAARYLTESVSPEFMKYEWILNKALDFLRCSVPLLLYAAIRYRRLIDWFLGSLGFLALAVPLRRADLISCFLVVILMITAFDRRALKKCAIAAVAALLAYVGTQIFFLGGSGPDDSAESDFFQKAMLTVLPEVRDLGWMIDTMHGEKLDGATLLQAVNPFPTFLSESKQENALGYVTMRAAGFDPGGTSGGLRVTSAGEWFLNFGMVGVAIGGLLFGVLIRWVARFFDRVAENFDEPRVYLAVQLFVWLGMWVYLAGTEAWGALRNGFILILFMIFLARNKTKPIGASALIPPLSEGNMSKGWVGVP